MSFGQRLTYMLKSKGITAYRLSKEIGISDSLIGYWKNNERQPNKDSLIKLADYFNCSIDYLVGRTDKPEFNK